MNVVDASVVLTFLMEEGLRERARVVLRAGAIVPEWLFVEVANTLATKTQFSTAEAKRALNLVYELGLEAKPVERQLLEKSMSSAKKYRVAVYDMIYALLAKKLKVPLVTADRRFIERTGFKWVRGL